MSGRLSALRVRARELPAHWVDGGLAALAVLITGVEAGFAPAPLGARAAALGPAAVVGVGLLLRNRARLTAIVIAIAGLTLTSLLTYDVWNSLNVIYFAFLLMIYSLAGYETGARLRAGIALGLVGVVLITLAQRHFPGQNTDLVPSVVVGIGFFVLAPVVAGRLLFSRLRLNDALAEKAAQAGAAREGRIQEAAAAERVRIASELHDLVAHALGAMTVQAAAARRLAVTDAERAGGAFAAIETTGRDALGELRKLLDVLRDDDGGDPLHAPQPTLLALPALAERAASFGLAVELDVQGERPDALPASVDLTAYRVVQDALRAAREDGGAGAARVRLRYRDDRVEIEVSDDGFRVSERRLLGLHERVRLYGGDVTTAARDGGHVLRARLPLAGVPA